MSSYTLIAAASVKVKVFEETGVAFVVIDRIIRVMKILCIMIGVIALYSLFSAVQKPRHYVESMRLIAPAVQHSG